VLRGQKIVFVMVLVMKQKSCSCSCSWRKCLENCKIFLLFSWFYISYRNIKCRNYFFPFYRYPIYWV